MKKIKLTEANKLRLRQAYDNCSFVLREIKQKTLEDKAYTDMRILEESVVGLECFLLGK